MSTRRTAQCSLICCLLYQTDIRRVLRRRENNPNMCNQSRQHWVGTEAGAELGQGGPAFKPSLIPRLAWAVGTAAPAPPEGAAPVPEPVWVSVLRTELCQVQQLSRPVG